MFLLLYSHFLYPNIILSLYVLLTFVVLLIFGFCHLQSALKTNSILQIFLCVNQTI